MYASLNLHPRNELKYKTRLRSFMPKPADAFQLVTKQTRFISLCLRYQQAKSIKVSIPVAVTHVIMCACIRYQSLFPNLFVPHLKC